MIGIAKISRHALSPRVTRLGPSAVRVTESQSGNQITLEVHTPRLLGLVLHRHSVRVEVSMPRQGDLNLHTGDGDIRVVNISGDFRVDSGDGNLEIRSADGTLNAETRDGNIRTSGRFDTLTLATATLTPKRKLDRRA